MAIREFVRLAGILDGIKLAGRMHIGADIDVGLGRTARSHKEDDAGDCK